MSAALAKDPHANLTGAAEDAIVYAAALKGRFLNQPGEIFTFGSGDCGQAGHGIEEDADLAVRYPRIVASLALQRVVVAGIACGGIHTAVYTSTGTVFTWGCSDDGSLGRSGDENTPLLVTDGGMSAQTVVGLSCGDAQTICVTSTGTLYGWGCYKDKDGKQFFDLPATVSGNPKSKEARKAVRRKQVEPMQLPFFGPRSAQHGSSSSSINGDHTVSQLVCGSCFNLVQCTDGAVYSWGTAECGELSRPVRPMKVPDPVGEAGDEIYDMAAAVEDYMAPAPMLLASTSASAKPTELRGGVKAIGCGSYHVLVVVDNRVYTTGLNNYGQLGHGHDDNLDMLTEVPTLTGAGVSDVKGGVHHSVALTVDGRLLAFGRGDSGQLGVPAITEEPGGFANIPVLPGQGSSGSGSGSTVKDTEIFTELANTKFSAIACGNNHNLALAADGVSLYTWGYGDMLALGHGSDKDEKVPRKINISKANLSGGGSKSKLTRISHIGAGGQHSAFIGMTA